jgi:type II secretion system protein C
VNRYQHEVETADRQHRLRLRLFSFVGAAVLAITVLWSAGLPPTQWWARVRALAGTDETSAQQPSTAPAAPLKQVQQETVAPPATSDALAGTDSSVSSVPLSLVLVATTPGRNSGEGTAKIGTDAANPQTYSAGALLANGARLAEIYTDHVVLRREGERVDLYLTGLPKTAHAKSDLLQIGGEKSQQTLVGATAREQLTDYLRPAPVYDAERLVGLRVHPGNHTGLFYQFGLEGGDVITHIDSAPVTDIATSIDLLNRLLEGQAMTVSVDRKGQRKHIALNGALILASREQATRMTASTEGAAGPM